MSRMVEASESCTILASEDIYDERGVKLLAKDQRVSRSLQERLLERKLRVPIESCLRAEDGVTPLTLSQALAKCLDEKTALSKAIEPHRQQLVDEVDQLKLHSAIQLLLTTAQETMPAAYEHAIRGMALAGALQASVTPSSHDIRAAMLGGLLHDIGEMYVDPAYLDGSRELDAAGYRHVVTHPRTGELLLLKMTDYPADVARGIGQHHERLGGTGYPSGVSRHELSWLGRLLSVTETALGILSAKQAPLARASIALRLVPGEYDLSLVSFFSRAAANADEDLGQVKDGGIGALGEHFAMLHAELQRERAYAQQLCEGDKGQIVRSIARGVLARLTQLLAGGNSLGVWHLPSIEISPQEQFELMMTQREVEYRMRHLRRDALWPYPRLSKSEVHILEPLWPRAL